MSKLGICDIVLNCESVDEILWCYHLILTSLTVHSHGTMYHVVLTFESVDEILWCYHSNETSSIVLSHSICFQLNYYKMKRGKLIRFLCWPY